jgi:hypothetical protein
LGTLTVRDDFKDSDGIKELGGFTIPLLTAKDLQLCAFHLLMLKMQGLMEQKRSGK